jgi:hypothetical protein
VLRQARLSSIRASFALASALVFFVAAATAGASETPLTAAQFRAKATAICTALNGYQIPADVSFVAGMQGALAQTRSSVKALGRLEPPASLRTLHAQALQEESRLVDDFSTLLAQVRSHDLTPSKVIDALGKDAHATHAANLWRRLGIPACAG